MPFLSLNLGSVAEQNQLNKEVVENRSKFFNNLEDSVLGYA